MTNAAENLPTDLQTAHFVINELALKSIELSQTNQELRTKIQELQERVDWFMRQVFGEKSEKVVHQNDGPTQLWLGGEAPEQTKQAESTTIKEHVRNRRGKEILVDDCGETGLRFDSTVPIEEISCPLEELSGLDPSEYEVIETKVTERLCQRSSYYVKRYLRPVVKLKANGELITAPAPTSVFERSYADVTLLSGILVDKFQYHLPLFRQHQRMEQSGIKLSRANLTNWVHRAAALLTPIYQAVLASVLSSQVLALDESPIKAGVEKKGKMHRGYMWVFYGDKAEVTFLYSETRALSAIEGHVKKFCGTLITDGYTVYDKLCSAYPEIEHALCSMPRSGHIPGGSSSRLGIMNLTGATRR